MPPQLMPSPQPQRPAPVLKPQVSRKPSLDKSVLVRKQQQQLQSDAAAVVVNGSNGTQNRPTYEETLKKCQSLTR